jgi:hypothetical protein
MFPMPTFCTFLSCMPMIWWFGLNGVPVVLHVSFLPFYLFSLSYLIVLIPLAFLQALIFCFWLNPVYWWGFQMSFLFDLLNFSLSEFQFGYFQYSYIFTGLLFHMLHSFSLVQEYKWDYKCTLLECVQAFILIFVDDSWNQSFEFFEITSTSYGVGDFWKSHVALFFHTSCSFCIGICASEE